ncbi:MAG: hypothetical protein ABSD53_12995 [Terriglobales bacterium]|jgi:hypothetical protein
MPVKNMAIRTVLLLLIPAGLISWAYPPNIYFRNFSFPFAVTLASYLTLYCLVLLVSMVLAPRLARRLSRTAGRRSAVQSLVAALAFAVLAGMIGTNGLDVPGTRFFGIFFAEWKFFIFFFYVGLPVAIATGIASFLTEKQTA